MHLGSVEVKSCYDLSSDHTPVEMTISSNISERNYPLKLTSNKTNWNKYRDYVNNKLSANALLTTEENIEDAIQHLSDTLQDAAWAATPRETINKSSTYPAEIRQKVVEKRRLRRIFMTTRQPYDKRKYNTAARQLTRQIKEYENKSFSNYIQALSPTAETNYSLWKATRKLKRPQQHISPIRKEDGTWARSAEEKVECLAKHFASVFKPAENVSTIENKVLEYLDAPLQLSLPIEHFNSREVEQTIKKHTHPAKSPGFDLITGKMLQEMPSKGYELVTSIFNAIL